MLISVIRTFHLHLDSQERWSGHWCSDNRGSTVEGVERPFVCFLEKPTMNLCCWSTFVCSYFFCVCVCVSVCVCCVQDAVDDTAMIRKHFVGRITDLNNQVTLQISSN